MIVSSLKGTNFHQS